MDTATHSASVSPGPAPDPEREFWRIGLTPDDVLVAEEAGEVVGSILTGHPTPLASNRHVVEIQGLAVDPGHQRRGIGSALVVAAVQRCRARGAAKVSLRVLSTNDAARRLYASHGFEVEGVLRGEFYLDGHAVDDVLMALHLGQAIATEAPDGVRVTESAPAPPMKRPVIDRLSP